MDHEPIYQVYVIEPSNSGFGEYVCNRFDTGEPTVLSYLEQCVADQDGEMFVLGRDNLPKDVEDIRGRIHNEPEIVVALRFVDMHTGPYVVYQGLDDVSDDDFEDLSIVKQRLADNLAGRSRIYTLEEVERDLGLLD